MKANLRLSIEDCIPLVDMHRYKKLVGSLMFLTNTRLDISYDDGHD